MKKLIAAFVAMGLTTSSGFAEALRTATLDVANMDCAVCPITVRKALEKVPGVVTAKVDFDTKRAQVVFDPKQTTVGALTKATAAAGYPSHLERVR